SYSSDVRPRFLMCSTPEGIGTEGSRSTWQPRRATIGERPTAEGVGTEGRGGGPTGARGARGGQRPGAAEGRGGERAAQAGAPRGARRGRGAQRPRASERRAGDRPAARPPPRHVLNARGHRNGGQTIGWCQVSVVGTCCAQRPRASERRAAPATRRPHQLRT